MEEIPKTSSLCTALTQSPARRPRRITPAVHQLSLHMSRSGRQDKPSWMLVSYLPGRQSSFPVWPPFSLQIQRGSRPGEEEESDQNPGLRGAQGRAGWRGHTHLLQLVRQKFDFFFIFILLFRVLWERPKHGFLKRRETGRKAGSLFFGKECA